MSAGDEKGAAPLQRIGSGACDPGSGPCRSVAGALLLATFLGASAASAAEDLVTMSSADSELAFRTDRAPVALVLDSIGAMVGLDVVLDGAPDGLVSGLLQGSLSEVLAELAATEPMVFDIDDGTLHVLTGATPTSQRLANDVSAILPIAEVMALGSPLASNRLQSDASGTLIIGHPAFVTRTTEALGAMLAMRGLTFGEPVQTDRNAPTRSRGRSGEPLGGLESIPGFNTL